MAARGRGRGRGRGGGGAQFLPRDDDGNVVFNKKQEGPPPLFPVSMFSIFLFMSLKYMCHKLFG
jgi:hypothetical protein